jgi:hypothetical protein
MMLGIVGKAWPRFFFLGELAFRLTQWLHSPKSRESFDDPEKANQHPLTNLESWKVGEPLGLLESDLEYLTREEANQIIARFESIQHSFNNLLFWTGIPRDWAQRWADDHAMLTLTTAMGPLMDLADPGCPKNRMDYPEWSRYVKGASGIFSRYACICGVIRVLTIPPSEFWRLRQNSTYRTIEEPVLKGMVGSIHALQINFVHLLAGSKEIEYEAWPDDHTHEWLIRQDTNTLDFLLPPPRVMNACSNITSGKKKKKRKKKERNGPAEADHSLVVGTAHLQHRPSTKAKHEHPSSNFQGSIQQSLRKVKCEMSSKQRPAPSGARSSGDGAKGGSHEAQSLIKRTESKLAEVRNQTGSTGRREGQSTIENHTSPAKKLQSNTKSTGGEQTAKTAHYAAKRRRRSLETAQKANQSIERTEQTSKKAEKKTEKKTEKTTEKTMEKETEKKTEKTTKKKKKKKRTETKKCERSDTGENRRLKLLLSDAEQ